MRILTTLICCLLISSCGRADDIKAAFDAYLGESHVIIIFTPSYENEEYQKQIAELSSQEENLKNHNIKQWVIIKDTVVYAEGKALPHIGTPPLYRHFKTAPQDFTFILIDKDGNRRQVSNTAIASEKLYTLIDAI